MADVIIKKLKLEKCVYVDIYFIGNNKRRKIIVKELYKSQIKINKMFEFTFLPHNGCRLKKQRRL
jgi:ribosomal protein S11